MIKRKAARFDLHDALSRYSYDHAVICTYTFEPDFFENYCLEKFNSLNSNRNLTVLVDRGIYESLILGPISGRPEQANIRYFFHPISVPGVFHPKLFLFVSKKKARLILGSANFTQPGITSNAELIGCFDYEEEQNTRFVSLFRSAFAFIVKVSNRWPSKTLDSNLRAIFSDAPWLVAENEDMQGNEMSLIHNLETPLWEQIVSEVSSPVKSVHVLSRFFDSSPVLLDRVCKDLRPEKIKIFTQNGITTMTKDYLRHPMVKGKKAEIMLCKYTDENHHQPLHAKAIAIEKGSRRLLAFGSANFTSSALLKDASRGNLEIMLLARDLTTFDFNPDKLFDPDKTALLLKDEATLLTRTQEDEYKTFPNRDIKLMDAILDESGIRISAVIPKAIQRNEIFVSLIMQGDIWELLSLLSTGEDKYIAQVPNDMRQRLNAASSIVRIEVIAQGITLSASNPLFLDNLQDIQTGRSIRRERHIKEAQQSADQFLTVINDIIQADDEEALKIFLTYCNIPVIEASQSAFFARVRPAWEGSNGMMRLGERNLTLFDTLHDAANYFLNRHFKKLQQHLEYGTLNGVPNFMHIFRAMITITHMQVERAVQGFESKLKPMRADEWATCRSRLDFYFNEFEEIMSCLCAEYLPMMLRHYKRAAVREHAAVDLDPLREICLSMLGVRERVETAIRSHLRVKTTSGQIVKPPYYLCIFDQQRWSKFAAQLRMLLADAEKALG
ncbi:MAG: hypothetical protein WBV94_12745 [Blastocatellia bacterium]